MGYSSVVGAAVASLMMIVGFSIFMNTSVNSIETLTDSFNDQITKAELQLAERCTLDRWKPDASNTLRFNATNAGATEVKSEDFEKIDVIVLWTRPGGTKVRQWIPYKQAASPTETYWKIKRVFWNQWRTEAINPISLTPTVYGVWDPLETLEIEVHIQDTVQTFDALILTMPNGFRAETSRIVEENRGTAICLDHHRYVDVTHGLTVTPTNIQITCRDSYGGRYYVSNVGATTFRINFSQDQNNDVRIYWVAWSD